MGRGNRRREGPPEYPLERVHTLARLSQINFTRKALDEAAELLPQSIAQPALEMKRTLLALKQEHWSFAEENERGWVDVYRIFRYNRLIWAKLKVEQRNTKDMVIMLSFHEYDDVPI